MRLEEDLNDFIQGVCEIPEIVIATPAVDWSDAYDYKTLSNYADLFIMGYDYHWSGATGPVDQLFGGSPWGQFALDWTVNDYLSLDVDPDRIILGLPLYGRSWSTVNSSVPGTSMVLQVQLLCMRLLKSPMRMDSSLISSRNLHIFSIRMNKFGFQV